MSNRFVDGNIFIDCAVFGRDDSADNQRLDFKGGMLRINPNFILLDTLHLRQNTVSYSNQIMWLNLPVDYLAHRLATIN